MKQNRERGSCKCRAVQGELSVAALTQPGTMAPRFQQVCVPNRHTHTQRQRAKQNTERARFAKWIRSGILQTWEVQPWRMLKTKSCYLSCGRRSVTWEVAQGSYWQFSHILGLRLEPLWIHDRLCYFSERFSVSRNLDTICSCTLHSPTRQVLSVCENLGF